MQVYFYCPKILISKRRNQLHEDQMGNKCAVIHLMSSHLMFGRTGSSEVFWGFQLVRIEEWSHLVGQLSQDALSESHTVSLQWQSHNNESKTYKYTCWHTSALSGQCRRVGFLLTWKSLKGTNWTMSLEATSPLGDVSSLSSLSRNSIALKSAPPTPTMIMDMGRREASTIAMRVRSISVITPSVRMSST